MKWLAEGLAAIFGLEPIEDEPMTTIPLREYRVMRRLIDNQQELIAALERKVVELKDLTRRGL